MKLIELKNIWEKTSQSNIEDYKIDETTVLKAIQKKSHSEISKIKRMMTIKLIMGSLATIVLIISIFVSLLSPKNINIINAFYNNKLISKLLPENTDKIDTLITPLEPNLILSTFAIFLIIMLVYNYKAYKKVKAVETTSFNLNKSIKEVIEIVENVVKLNVKVGTMFMSLTVSWISYLVIYKNNELLLDINFLYLLIIIIITIGVFYFIELFGQKIKFGRYIKRLKLYQKELIEEKNG